MGCLGLALAILPADTRLCEAALGHHLLDDTHYGLLFSILQKVKGLLGQ